MRQKTSRGKQFLTGKQKAFLLPDQKQTAFKISGSEVPIKKYPKFEPKILTEKRNAYT